MNEPAQSQRRVEVVGATVTIVALLVIFTVFLISIRAPQANAATTSFTAWERELGAQKIEPDGSAKALAIPTGTLHAEIHVTGGSVFVRWNGGTPVDSGTATSWGAFPWPDGHFRKEENDGQKLSGLRVLCDSCTVWVNYFGKR